MRSRNVDLWMAADPRARLVLRLQNEVQMLWHPHPLNDEREALGGSRWSTPSGWTFVGRFPARWLQASGVFALLPANAVDDDTFEFYADETRTQVLLRGSPLRLQTERPVVDGPNREKIRRPNRCLADFVAPKSGPGVRPDYIGLFAVTAGLGVEKKERQFIADHDEDSAILLKALADRLAEAFAEHLHP